ncbi:NAD(P)-binding domain-containing protein [Photobacterium sp. WH77]|uniref:flavin-containing monooxygenase n=1 Tax=unclassified Photobacterium TaxID=2628852 RepID=UPI001EDA9026|nr:MULTISPECIES: NAD(P)-binding domain-containing protein [unclassified Photobacterium]MCG2837100.1 NAD(P)-binding domain-containing protein [Photobacterium sp. WH77]MCG2844750.1 NAD(P)-binding domain-containing protein [Photobacterium sp. WH80]
MHPYVVIGAGPMGLCTVRRLAEQGLPVIGLEAHADVGGLWDISSPTSTMYQSAHLISSKRMTEFSDFPMADHVATYPKHDQLCRYFQDYARHFNLYGHYRFHAWVEKVEPCQGNWLVTYRQHGETFTLTASGVLLANGTLHHPRRGNFGGDFQGEQFHSSDYKSAEVFAGKRVLIVGCGNSACDIAVDAVHRARSVDMVIRRGYYFLPKFVAGIPTDTLGGKVRLPNRLKQMVDGTLVRLISGKPSQFGLPDPDYRMYESHPVVNSMFLHHIGHGDITVRPSIEQLLPTGARFQDGQEAEYDLILEATGYSLHYPFIDRQHLNWNGDAPGLYLNIFTPQHDNLFVMGMVEASGLGWQGRDDQAQLVARFIRARHEKPAAAEKFMHKVRQQASRRIDGGIAYLNLERMAYYVHKADYLAALNHEIRQLQWES